MKRILNQLKLRSLGDTLLPKSLYNKLTFLQIRSLGSLSIFLIIGLGTLVSLGFFVSGLIETIGYFQQASTDPQFIFGQNTSWLLLGIFLGLSGISLMALNLILATRWGIVEKLFAGLDKVYKVHNLLGRLSFTVLIFHPAVLVLSAIPNWELLRYYIVPGTFLPYSIGAVALSVLLVLIVLTIAVRMPYHWWLWTHRFMGLPLLIGGIHAYLINPDYQNVISQRLPFLVLWTIGVFAYVYTLFLYRRLGQRHRGEIKEVVQKGDVAELTIVTKSAISRVLPGQFFFLSVEPATGASDIPDELHPFSVTSIRQEATGSQVSFAIKSLGDYTSKLPQVKSGDKVSIYGPHGQFGEKYLNETKPMIWIAGGIGITPFLSMIQHEIESPGSRPISLIWSVKYPEEAIYSEQIRQVHFDYLQYESGETNFLTAEKVLEMLSNSQKGIKTEELAGYKLYLCGPPAMMFALANQFIKLGMPDRNIVFEEFSFN